VTHEPRAFVAIDRGSATTAVSVLARLDHRWRLVGATSAPVSVASGALIERLRARLVLADPDLAAIIGLDRRASAEELPRVTSTTEPPPEIAVVAATGRALSPMADAAALSGWRVRRVTLDGAPIVGVATALSDARITTVLAGAGDPPGADERPLLPELAAQVTAATERRPDLVVVLAGALAAPGGRFEPQLRPDRPGATLRAPSSAAGSGPALGPLLDGLRAGGDDGRRAVAATTGTLAEVLERSVEVVDIGRSAGTRVIAEHAPGAPPEVASAIVAEAALLPRGFADSHLDAIGGWLTAPLDRLRLRDRLRELALAPWGDSAGDGALLRLAAGRAALERLLAATRSLEGPPTPLLVAAGGAWAVAPGPAVALALADVVRRPGVRALGLDHAHLLGPLGTIEDPAERRDVVADLRDELLVPLGSIVMPAGLRSGRVIGQVVLRGASGQTSMDLFPGGIELVDLPPGERAVAELRFRDAVNLGARARHIGVEVAGGLGGVLIDLRDVPLHLPDRPERRREVLATWERALWPGIDT
jgi:hypothetical protein